ncbi:PDR/VanB family oxidoreductase [Rhizohabitans arisaemae]|uniref:PDR/VanB family oxidoreductase n=1 Tax=Rhizohabitans arisaemae TaxID=2720610 RepID=UPI0024B0442A|nr:PDR/VanB family oxidoreductase [Rhizohabitans arisaemae]
MGSAIPVIVGRRTAECADVVVLDLVRADGLPLDSWSPGSHIDLLLDIGAEAPLPRQYSLCGDVGDGTRWRIAVLREQSGRGGSAHIHDHLHEGAATAVRGPRNNFPLEPAPEYLFIAGGIGITPLLPMIAEAERTGTPWRLYYGGRTRTRMAFAEPLATTHPDRVTLIPQDEHGLPDIDAIVRTAAATTAVYCCGPAGLLDAVESTCRTAGRRPPHLERFAPKARKSDETADGEFEVELVRTGVTCTIPPGRSILQVAEEAGADVFGSCLEGICGTCETTVLDGTPDHRDSVLPDGAEGTMMICVSRAASRRLVLDL